MLAFYENEETKFDLFYLDLIKLMDKIADAIEEEEDPEKILGAFATPAERIVKTLMSIKQKLSDSEEDVELGREINFAINNITERKIYNTLASQINLTVSQSENPLLNKMASPLLRKMNSNMVDYLNEYSEGSKESSNSSSLRNAKIKGISR